MIRVSVFDSGVHNHERTLSYRALGHSGAQRGAVCTACSVIGYTLAGYIHNLRLFHPKEIECRIEEDAASGSISVSATVHGPLLAPMVAAVFEAAFIGASQVSAYDGQGEVEVIGQGAFSDRIVLTKPTDASENMLSMGNIHLIE